MLFELLLCVVAIGQPEAKIDAPISGRIGDLVIFNASESKGVKNYKWKSITETQGFLVIDNGSRAVFSTHFPGQYTFILAVSAENGDLDLVSHTITVGMGLQGVDIEQAVGVQKLKLNESLEDKVKEWIKGVKSENKIQESNKLAGSFKTAANLIKTGNVTEEEELFKATKTFAKSDLGEGIVNWDGWFKSLSKEMSTTGPEKEDLDSFYTIWLKISQTLRDVK